MTIRLVDAQNRIQWDTFTVQDTFAVQFLVNKGAAIISESMLDFILSTKTWSGVRYQNLAGEYEIGYGIGDPDDTQGNTEPQAYAEWIGFVRNEQKKLQAQLPVIGISQATFDALLSLYLDTGTWRTVEADEGTYDLADAVKNSNWLLAADIISRGNINPNIRKAEARVMQLGDYSATKDRNQQIIQGVQRLRKQYVNGLSNEFDKRQAEFVYYRQLGAFLPGMSQLRQRRVVAQSLS
jgi:hypothetical protein|tara:strand:- start:324 stop:1037 length:714 start_codon:yes stop_codon:yes gene_type:complete